MKLFVFLPFLFLLSCTVQERYHRRGLTTEWNTISVKKAGQKKSKQVDVQEDLATNNDEIQLTKKEIHIVEPPQELEITNEKFTEPTDSIEKERKRKRINSNIILASLAAISVGGLAQYINYSNEKIDPNVISTPEYANYQTTWQASYLVGSALLSWRIKRALSYHSSKRKNSIVSDTTSSNQIILDAKQAAKNEIIAKKKADDSLSYIVVGILYSIIGVGILMILLGIMWANQSIKLAPNAPSAIKAARYKRIGQGYLKILLILIPVFLALGVIALVPLL
ncbi:MAG: hypothetical protein ACKO00_07315 [Crocinitomicaceae bacterium]